MPFNLLLSYPHHFWLEAIAEELMAALKVHIVRNLAPPKIACHVVVDLELVHLITKVYEVTVRCKCDIYHCWLTFQVALRCLTGKILSIVRYVSGHHLVREGHFERVVTVGNDLDFLEALMSCVMFAPMTFFLGGALILPRTGTIPRGVRTMRTIRESTSIIRLLLRNICSFVIGCWKLVSQGFVPLFGCI